ncbi:hypothetical protein B0H66DRAFT_572617 [Apodospora peruviana]|uniref:RRM domain-containing protein n=1 Tax=Apodospora peruviana TaxID=516989 RepID=A0AAE0ISS2_9PEZI|nr:hypothetical protein B0H66DRAFT_572617 [Apodospora peruviana]
MNGDQNPTGASSGAPTKSFAPLSSSRASPFPSSVAVTKNAMAAPAFSLPAPTYRPTATSQPAYTLSVAPVNHFDRDATKPVGTPYSATPPAPTPVLIRNLPLNTSEESLRLMMVFSKDLVDVEVLPVEESEDPGFRSALLKFNTVNGAHEAKMMLHGKSNISNDAKMIVEVVGSSPTALSKRYTIDTSVPAAASTAASSAASSAVSSRQATRFNGAFQSLDNMTPNGVYNPGELTSPESNGHYQNMYSPQSPIGNHLRISGKSLINNDAADDDETGELLKDPVGFAENGPQRRQTAPQIPISRMASLSLNTTPTTGPSPMSQYGHPGMGSLSGLQGPSTMSPTVMGVPGQSMGYSHPQSYRPPNFPPANPADQNPPCNTLYVGNLPIDTSEEELKAMFSKCRGYKRLCFRTKQNGPMCFVEFEDISFATKALHELYGQPLHNSVKGGIRLSFSKNPLGVRSGQTPGQSTAASVPGMNGVHSGSGTGFTTASGPPPGLSAPPGLGPNRSGYSASPGLGNGSNNSYTSPAFSSPPNNPWASMYNGHAGLMASAPSSFPPHMMGR